MSDILSQETLDLIERAKALSGHTEDDQVIGAALRLYIGQKSRGLSVEERFWGLVAKGTGCWLWRGALCDNRYGSFRVGPGETERAHRFSWILANGPIPEGLSVLHSCDVTCCVRPDHLRVGTQIENMQDRSLRGRVSRKGNPKLTPDQVTEIRKSYADGEKDTALARKFKVSTTNIRFIITGQTWKEVVL